MEKRNLLSFFVFWVFVFIWIITSTGTVSSTSYYVNATTGNNSNSGTSPASPWQTISKVNSFSFNPGDNIYFERGQIFTGYINVGDSGNISNYITYGAYGNGDSPVINASGQSYGIDIQVRSYIQIQNLTIENADTGQFLLFNGISDIEIDSVTTSGSNYGVYVLNGANSNISIKNSNMTGHTTGGIYFGGGTHSNIIVNNMQISGCQDGIIASTGTVNNLSVVASEVSNSTDNGLELENTGTINILNISLSNLSSNNGVGMYSFGNLSNLTIDDSFFEFNINEGIKVAPGSGNIAQSVHVRDILSYGNNGTGIFFGGAGSGIDVTLINITSLNNTSGGGLRFQRSWSSVSISNSTFINNSGDGLQFYLDDASAVQSDINISNIFSRNNSASGFQFLGTDGSGSDVILSNVTVSNNNHDGINIKGGWDNIGIYNSTIESNGVDGTDSDGDGISYHNSANGTIKYCFISNNIKSAVAHVGDSSVNMSYNIFRHDTNGTIALVHLEGTGEFDLFNNVIYSRGITGTGIHVMDNGTKRLYNNLVYGFDTGILNGTDSVVINDYNNIYGAATSNWTNITQGANSISIDPLFLNISGYMNTSADFQLEWNSSSIDSGADINLTIDFNNNPIYGIPDIGAYEYQPPYNISVNSIEYNSIIRIYSDGKFRYKNRSSDFSVGNKSIVIAPGAGYATHTAMQRRNASYDVELQTWTNSNMKFNMTNLTSSGDVSITVCNLTASSVYTLYIDSSGSANYTTNSNGCLSFTYAGSWSEHEFELIFIPSQSLSSGGSIRLTYHLTTAQLRKGYEKSLIRGQKLRFNLNNTEHELKITGIQKQTVTILLSSDPITFNLSINETKKIDFDRDNYSDLSILLKGIKYPAATLVVKLINESVPQEDGELIDDSGDLIDFWSEEGSDLIYVIGGVVLIILLVIASIIIKPKIRKKSHKRIINWFKDIFSRG